jgi:predicted ATPase
MIGVVPRLLERAAELHRLHSAVDRAAAARGVTVLVTGEPGIGKTSLLQAFVAELETRTRVLAGVCEDLLTPRALGALWGHRANPTWSARDRSGGPSQP